MKRCVMLIAGFLIISAASAQTTADGVKALDYENFATAKSILRKLIAQQPSDAKNYYYLGQVYSILGQKDSARVIYNAGTQADPKSIYNNIGMGRTYLDQNNAQKAKEYFDKARSLTSAKDITLYTLMADAYINSDHPNYQEAVNLLNKAMEYNNKSADVYWLLGNAYEAMGKGGDAVSSYERSGELNPSYAKAYTRIGVIWRLARNYNQSLTSLQSAVTADPNFPPAYREMAELYFYTGQYDKAKETYQKYQDLADKDDYNQFRYAQYLFLTKDYQGAMNILNQVKTKIDQPVLWRLMAYSNYELGNYEEGLRQMNEFFEKTSPEKILASDYEYYGRLLTKTGQDSVGFQYYEKAIAMDSTKFNLYNEEGGILFQQKKYHQAAEAYVHKIVASIKDATLQDYFNAGKSYYFAKEFQQADSAFAEMTKLNKTWPISYFWRARVMTNLDNPDTVKGLAAPFYHAVVDKAMADTAKYRKELMEAYKYLGDINALKENYGVALYYYEKYMAYDPANEDVLKTVESVKALYKSTSTSSVPLQKDANGAYLIPAQLNGKEVSLVFDSAQPGIAVTPDGASQIFGRADGGTMISTDKVTIASRVLKNPDIQVQGDLPAPAVIGAFALNHFNIVLDYPTGSLLLK